LRPYILDSEYLIENFGTFSIPLDYYQAFKILGSFINGQDSILFKWAAFSVNASRRSLSTETVINQVLKSPVTEREIQASRRIYDHVLKKEGKVYCVWTGKQITKFDIDHVIPFSIWKNNNLWNLLPSQKSVNIRKRDKIPAVAFLGEQQELIFHYWHLLNEAQPIRFQKEIRFSLLGNETNKDWKQLALKQLQKSCDYLISERGYEEWSI
jgi:CRISPR/Cas system Type II protein with McrA/HNH and RuvC-like nuclease domain